MRVPVVMIFVLAVYSILVDAYIWNDIRKYSRGRLWSRFYATLSVLCWLFLVVVLLLPRRDNSESTLTVMWCLYSYITVYVPKFFYVLCSAAGMLFSGRKRRHARLNMGVWVGIPVALLVFAFMWWGALRTRRDIEVVEVDVESVALPKGFNGFTIVQLSDMHVGTWGNDTTFISNLVDSVNARRPDMIVFTGDIVNCSTSELLPFMDVLSRLKAPVGVYSILGNHDYGDYLDWPSDEEKMENLELMNVLQKKMGWRLLNNDSEIVRFRGDSIAVIGVENWGEPPFHQYGRLSDSYGVAGDTLHHLNDGVYKVLLSHNPEHWNREVTEVSNIDLTLSGHTHAMQIMISLGDWKWSPSVWRYEQWGGLYERLTPSGKTLKLYVNIGSGEVGMPFRIGATPEITMLRLVCSGR